MGKPKSLQNHFDNQCEKIHKSIIESCRNIGQYTAVCVMAMERYNMQLNYIEKRAPYLAILSQYQNILDDLERLVCDSRPITADMGTAYENWCIQIESLLEHRNINYHSHWQLQLLSSLMEKLGTFFSNWVKSKALLPWDAAEVSLVGVWWLFCYEEKFRYPNPKNFNYYSYIRAKYPKAEELGKQSEIALEKAEKDVKYEDECKKACNLFREECEKYMNEAVAERERLIAEYKPATVEDIVLTTKEMERVLSDVAFVTDLTRSKEDIRQRLAYYRTIDIACEV